MNFDRNSYIFIQAKMPLKLSSAKWMSCCRGRNMLKHGKTSTYRIHDTQQSKGELLNGTFPCMPVATSCSLTASYKQTYHGALQVHVDTKCRFGHSSDVTNDRYCDNSMTDGLDCNMDRHHRNMPFLLMYFIVVIPQHAGGSGINGSQSSPTR